MSRCWKITSSACGVKAAMIRTPSSRASVPQGQEGRDVLSLSPQEKGHNRRCGDLQPLVPSLGRGNGHVGISSCFGGAEGEAWGDGAAVLRAAGATECIDLGDTGRCFL